MAATTRKGASDRQSLATVIRESANHIWLAGLGAYARAEEEGGRLFDNLVELGEQVESRARDQVFRPIRAAERKAGEVRTNASGIWEQLHKAFERRVARFLNALQIPTSRDVEALTTRVEELQVLLERMERDAAAGAGVATRRAKAAAASKRRAVRGASRRTTGGKAAAGTEARPAS